jgi:anaerobic selenocysteine-containing dehydrogenase
VLPAATWGEKTGIFTNADRTVHLSEKAVEPPGEARPDLDIFLDFAARMGFTDKDGGPLITWHDPESAFAAWQRCSAGRPCDYTGLSYGLLRERGGIQWPCTEQAPDGTERLYADGRFWAAPDYCESYGRDLVTGASVEETEYRALNPDGKAIIKAATYLPPHEPPDGEFPMQLITGRTIYHFHTRTKTGRAPQLDAAAPQVWAELNPEDAAKLGVQDGEPVDLISPRGRVRAEARFATIRRGTVFVPFHYGYWDTDHPAGPEADGDGRAANELTVTDWDPASKQPLFKLSSVRVQRTEDAGEGGRR